MLTPLPPLNTSWENNLTSRQVQIFPGMCVSSFFKYFIILIPSIVVLELVLLRSFKSY